MSREQDYFAPKGTKWKWGPKALQHYGWFCHLSEQREPGLFLWPVSIQLRVDLDGGKFHWVAEVYDWRHARRVVTGARKDALKACLAAEAAGEAALDELLPEWVRTALAHGWRSPV